jgi:serine/threonine protein kinase
MNNGTRLRSAAGREYVIRRFIAAGGQGEVYEVLDSATKTAYALKWYFKHSATAYQRKLIKRILDRGAPDSRFLWPLDIVEARGSRGSGLFGYIMRLRPSNYKSIIDLMKRRAEPTFGALCMAGINLADGYHSLHSNGLCYRDISFGNLFFDPKTGDVLICDNDNVTVNRDSESGTDGTPRFIAPEIICSGKSPSTETDLYSMAVLLFYMFMLHHPLEGAKEANIKCFDGKAMEKIYGHEPVFIWHPTDFSNRPVPGYQDNAIIFWKIYPLFIREMFTIAFTEGLKNPGRRIVEKQWKEAFSRLHSSIILCPRCRLENFAMDDKANVCWGCCTSIPLPPHILIAGNALMLNRDTTVYEYGANGLFDYTSAIGRVQQHPSDPGKWGIKNIGGSDWVYIRANGEKSVIKPGRSAPIIQGTKIGFGNIEGIIEK